VVDRIGAEGRSTCSLRSLDGAGRRGGPTRADGDDEPDARESARRRDGSFVITEKFFPQRPRDPKAVEPESSSTASPSWMSDAAQSPIASASRASARSA
jgi:hypothetical protein